MGRRVGARGRGRGHVQDPVVHPVPTVNALSQEEIWVLIQRWDASQTHTEHCLLGIRLLPLLTSFELTPVRGWFCKKSTFPLNLSMHHLTIHSSIHIFSKSILSTYGVAAVNTKVN